RRYETASGLARDIQRYLNKEPVKAGPPSASYQMQKFASKHRRLLAVAAAFALVLTAGIAVSSWQAIRASLAEQTARRERDNAILEKERANEQALIAEAVNRFLNEDLLFQAAPDGSPDRDLRLRTVLDRAARNIEGRFPSQPLVEARLRTTIGL